MVKKVSEAPEGIKILAVLYFASALIFIGVGMYIFNFADSIKTIDPGDLVMLAVAGISLPGPGPMALIGLLFVAVSIFCYFLAKGLLAAKAWAKLVIGIGVSLSIVFGIIGIFNGTYFGSLSSIIVNGLILWYLFFKESTKKFFK